VDVEKNVPVTMEGESEKKVLVVVYISLGEAAGE
jgi:hypothetical protein